MHLIGLKFVSLVGYQNKWEREMRILDFDIMYCNKLSYVWIEFKMTCV